MRKDGPEDMPLAIIRHLHKGRVLWHGPPRDLKQPGAHQCEKLVDVEL